MLLDPPSTKSAAGRSLQGDAGKTGSLVHQVPLAETWGRWHLVCLWIWLCVLTCLCSLLTSAVTSARHLCFPEVVTTFRTLYYVLFVFSQLFLCKIAASLCVQSILTLQAHFQPYSAFFLCIRSLQYCSFPDSPAQFHI